MAVEMHNRVSTSIVAAESEVRTEDLTIRKEDLSSRRMVEVI
jgi:hypothetical protein